MRNYVNNGFINGGHPPINIENNQDESGSSTVRALAELVGFAARLNGSRSLHNLLATFIHGLSDIWPGAGVRMCEVDWSTGNLIPVEDLGAEPIPIKGSLLGNAVTGCESIFIDDLENSAAYIRGREAPAGLLWRSALVCPMPMEEPDYVVGVFIPARVTVTHADLRLLERAVSLISPLVARWRSQDVKLDAFLAIARAIASAVDSRDPSYVGHGERVSEFAQATAHVHGLETGFVDRLGLAGLLHDIGRIGIPEKIIAKNGSLEPDEYKLVKAHPELSVRFLDKVEYLEDVFPAIRHHHERFDGGGYPLGLEDEDIPLGARILAIADAFDAMTSPRPFREPLTDIGALKELQDQKGAQFDPILVESFIRAYEERLIVSQNILRADDPLADLRGI